MKHLKKLERYTPKIISLNPQRVIPYHQVLNIKEKLIKDYQKGNYIPPIPVFSAPEDFLDEGDYINYNGHHRTEAARIAGVSALGILLESWQDIIYLDNNPPFWKGEVYPELIEGLDRDFEAHRNFIIHSARQFKKLREIANTKNIKL